METQQVFLLIALVSSGLFLVQFVLSLFMGGMDMDVDVDGDADVDTDMGSVFSFKGLLHFLIGFGWTMYLAGNSEWYTYLAATVVGVFLVWLLWRLYMLAMRLQNKIPADKPDQLVGRRATIYMNAGNGRYEVQVDINGALRQLDVVSRSGRTDYVTGQAVSIEGYAEKTFYIG